VTNPKIINSVRLIQKCLILNEKGQALALKRTPEDNHRGLKWDFPGGGYEQGENLADSIIREVREESGLTLISFRPLFLDNRIGEKTGLYAGDHVFAICQLALSWEGEVKLSNEHTDFRWVDPRELLTYDFGEDGGFFSASLSAYLDYQR